MWTSNCCPQIRFCALNCDLQIRFCALNCDLQIRFCALNRDLQIRFCVLNCDLQIRFCALNCDLQIRFILCTKLWRTNFCLQIVILYLETGYKTRENGIWNTEFIDHNRPFPSSLVPLFQSEYKCETIVMKMTLICMRMKLHTELIFIWKVSHLDSFWNRGTRELGNGLFEDRNLYVTI